MLFSEIYGSYFQVVARILTRAVEGGLTQSELTDIVRENGFAESVLSIPAALRAGHWPVLDGELNPVIRNRPTMPLTTLQKRWLKALLLDPRIALFDPDPAGLEEVEPLFRPDTFVYFDRYTDGDPYEDENYIACFRLALQAIREKRRLRIRFHGRTGLRHTVECIPYRMEYSEKDDKFRLLIAGTRRAHMVNMARVYRCELLEEYPPHSLVLPREHRMELTMLLHDRRNGLNRVLLHFSHFEKETVKLEEDLYRIRLYYELDDETELLIRVLSFGPVLEVVGPEDFAEKLKARLRQQLQLTGMKGNDGNEQG